MASHAITKVAIILRPEDDVAIAKKEIAAGTILEDADGPIEVRQDIKPGHKAARPARRVGGQGRRGSAAGDRGGPAGLVAWGSRSGATGSPSASPPPTSRSAITSTSRTWR